MTTFIPKPTIIHAAGQAVIVRSGQWVRYSTPAPEGAEYIAVCLPAFAPDLVHRDTARPYWVLHWNWNEADHREAERSGLGWTPCSVFNAGIDKCTVNGSTGTATPPLRPLREPIPIVSRRVIGQIDVPPDLFSRPVVATLVVGPESVYRESIVAV